MKDYLVDVPVLLIFFSRPEQFKMVFEQVKKARPSKLFLYQDGARENRPDDIVGIQECRKIAEDIDWECEVERLYQEKNFGCDPSEFIAQKWAFSQVDKCIVLEDDDVPSVSFFTFCKDMLDRYENDTRIGLISGLNYDEITTDAEADYLFTSHVAIWGWASWKRVIDQWDGEYSFLDKSDTVEKLRDTISKKKLLKNFVSMCERHRETGKEHYETILIANHWLNDYLAIVPAKNMINNIGATENSTHFSGNIKCQPKGIRRIFTMKRYELDSTIKHPSEIKEHPLYKKRVYRIMAWGHPIVKAWRFAEETIYMLANGNKKEALNNIKGKLNKLIKRTTY